MAFFEQSKQNNDIIERVDRIAATINQKVVERTQCDLGKNGAGAPEPHHRLLLLKSEYLMQFPSRLAVSGRNQLEGLVNHFFHQAFF